MLPQLRLVSRVVGFLTCIGAALVHPALAADEQEPAAVPVTAYTHVTLIDGTGGPAAPDVAIVVAGERIKAVQPMASFSRDALGAAGRVVDLSGKFALPGLIDTHQHVGTQGNRPTAEAQLYRMIYGGVTTVRDMAGDGRFLANLARAARLAELPSPDLCFSALMAGPSFFSDPRTHASARGAVAGKVPWLQAITADTDMVIAVAMARGTGASGIKIYANLPAAEVNRIVAEAHRQGFPVWAHAAIFPARPGDGIAAGIDSVSHAYMLGYEFNDLSGDAYQARAPIDRDRLNRDTTVLPAIFAEMRRRGTILDATVQALLKADQKAKPGAPKRGDIGVQVTRAAYRAGVAISAGTDFEMPADETCPALQLEMETLVADVGMSTSDVIRAATSVAARALKLEAETGTVAPGKLANLVFVSRNPLDDIKAFRGVMLTVKRGREYPRTDYRQPDARILAEDY